MACDDETWLPGLVVFEDYNGNWNEYLDAVYSCFLTDFVYTKPVYEGRRLGLKRHPVTHGKEATFWHMIQEGSVEEDRTPDFRRCERIKWPRAIIENANRPTIKVWKNNRRGETRICLWLEQCEYLVILADRGNYILPWTAYPVTQEHRKRKLEKEYQKYLRRIAE